MPEPINYSRPVRIPFADPISEQYEVRSCENSTQPGGGRHHYMIRSYSQPSVVDWELALNFQKGPLPETGHNGILSNILLTALIDHLRSFQDGEYRSRETACAITHLEEALHWIAARADERDSRGVIGAHKA